MFRCGRRPSRRMSMKGDHQMSMIRRVSIGLAVLAVSVLGTTGAHADSPGDAWAAAKPILPASPYVVMGMNVATIKGSTIFQQLYPKLLAQSGESKAGLETVRTDCGIDVKEAIQGVVVAIDESNAGIVVLSTKGVDKTKINECLVKVAQKEKKEVTAGTPDKQGIVEYTIKGESDHVFIAYLPKGVMAIATEPKDKALLQKWLGGKGVDGKSATGAALGKVNTGAAVWAVVNKAQQLEP